MSKRAGDLLMHVVQRATHDPSEHNYIKYTADSYNSAIALMNNTKL